jgi:Protein of unknown function (DUF998)
MDTTISGSAGSSEKALLKKGLLICGILSSLYYVALNIVVPVFYEGYSYAAHTVSELSAIGAPTRPLWVLLVTVYILLFVAFGWGVLKSAHGNPSLRFVGVLIIAYSVVNIYWPPMHQRGVEPSLTDTLHIAWAMVAVLFMMVMMGVGATAFGKRFRLYTIVSMVVLIGLGVLTSLDAPKIPQNLPTPWLGVWERIMIGVFLIWVVVLAVVLLRNTGESAASFHTRSPGQTPLQR